MLFLLLSCFLGATVPTSKLHSTFESRRLVAKCVPQDSLWLIAAVRASVLSDHLPNSLPDSRARSPAHKGEEVRHVCIGEDLARDGLEMPKLLCQGERREGS